MSHFRAFSRSLPALILAAALTFGPTGAALAAPSMTPVHLPAHATTSLSLSEQLNHQFQSLIGISVPAASSATAAPATTQPSTPLSSALQALKPAGADLNVPQTALPAPAAKPAAAAQPAATTLLAPAVVAPAGAGLINTPANPGTGTAIGTSAPPGEDTEDTGVELTPTFGTKALNFIITAATLLREQTQAAVTNFGALPAFNAWLKVQGTDPRLQKAWAATGQDLIYVLGPALLVAFALDLVLYPVRRALRRRRVTTIAGKITMLGGLFLLRIAPIIVFIGTIATLIDPSDAHRFPRFVVLNITYALALSRFCMLLVRAVLAPAAPDLRLVSASTTNAAYMYHRLSAFIAAIIYGYFIMDLARALRVPAPALQAFGNIFGLLLVTLVIIVIVQKRAVIAVRLRGNLSAATPDLTFIQSLRLWLARSWHVLAIGYLIVGYAIAALGVQNGFAIMLRGTVFTAAIILGMRLLFGLTNRWGAREAATGAAMHHAILRLLVRAVIWMLAALALVAAWGANLVVWFATPIGQRILGAAFSIAVTITVLALIYETFSTAVDRHLNQRGEDGKTVQASARALTLLPMLRNSLFIVFAIVAGMVVVSEAGFNIAPLLAGAGVLGVAVGFGSQTLVKDFLTGLFIAVENTISVGDVVSVGTHSGVVESMSIRTLRIRDQDGGLHILPFSEVSQIINQTRDFAYAVMKIGVSYDTDLDHAMNVMRSVGEEMQKDPIFGRVILDPIEILGVDSLGDYAITLLARIRTRPIKQWDVKRMYLLKLKKRFDKEGIEIPFPTVSNITRMLASHPADAPESGDVAAASSLAAPSAPDIVIGNPPKA